MKNLTKPISISLSFILLFFSCSQYESNIDIAKEDPLKKVENLDSYIQNHINLTFELFDSLKNIETIDVDSLLNSTEILITYEDINAELIFAQVENHEEVAQIIVNIHENLIQLYQFNAQKVGLTKDQLLTKIDNSINLYFDNEMYARLTCAELRERSRLRCIRNYGLSVAAISISTFWSFGIGTGIAAVVALGIMTNCMFEADSDYEECQGN